MIGSRVVIQRVVSTSASSESRRNFVVVIDPVEDLVGGSNTIATEAVHRLAWIIADTATEGLRGWLRLRFSFTVLDGQGSRELLRLIGWKLS